jgi:hypothetical protein
MEDKSLYQINNDLAELYYRIELQGGELTEEQEQYLQITEKNLSNKMFAYIKVIKGIESTIATAREYKEQAEKIIRLNTNVIEKMKGRMLEAVLNFGDVQTDLYKISTRKSSPVEITDENKVPEKFKVWKASISKTDIANAIKSGEDVEGAEIIEKVNLSIK